MMPTNEELKNKYEQKLKILTEKVTKVQIFYSQLEKSDSSLENEIKIQGCKIMIHNSINQIEYCKKQIEKWSSKN